MPKVEISYITNRGLIRANNEDSLLAGNEIVSSSNMEFPKKSELSGKTLMFAVADGMGGYEKGEVASKIVVETLKKYSGEIKSFDSVKEVLFAADYRMKEFAAQNHLCFGMGTTVAGVAFGDEGAVVFNVGDSRIYHCIEGRLERLTRDHSMVFSLYESGLITEDEMRFHPQKNIVTSAITASLGETSFEVFLRERDYKEGEIFMLCTDGVWEAFDRMRMEEIFVENDPYKICKALYIETIKSGAKDNLTIIVAKIKGGE